MKRAIATAFAAVILGTSGGAIAQERTWFDREQAAPAKAFELSISSAYTQGFGMLREATSLPDVAGPGIGLGIGAGYRFNPRWGASLQGQFQELDPNRNAGARGGTATAAVQYHLRPTTNFDPWVELGAGYRMLWETRPDAPTILSHGIQIARARLGADLRVSQDVALGPFIGADLTTFLFQEGAALDSPRASTFILGGIQGRFDIGGERTVQVRPAIAKR